MGKDKVESMDPNYLREIPGYPDTTQVFVLQTKIL